MASLPFRKAPERAGTPRVNPHPTEIPVSRTSSLTTRSTWCGDSSILAARTHASIPPLPTQSTHFASRVCEECELSELIASPIWNCSYCDMDFCDACWDKQKPHKLGRTGPDGLPHEKADPNVVESLRNILTPTTDPGEQKALHVEDKDTTWFSIARDEEGTAIFQDYGRYAAIISESNTGFYTLRYPQLVSFIGQTGAGKSTLIKMLIDQQRRRSEASQNNVFPSPVVGSQRNENVPTSGDVHLYADPATYTSEYPMLYADCEGLEGGENLPISAQYCNNSVLPKGTETAKRTSPDHRRHHKFAKTSRGTQRNIKWADSPEKAKRQYAVTQLYPRLLYTFSDVIVFVLRNSRTFESSVLSKLINWASASLEKSLNQPTLPHVVIAFNATDSAVSEEEWDPEDATTKLMSHIAGVVHIDSAYRHLAEYWIGRGKKISTTRDLLECYYSSITVVRIPVKGRYMRIDQQIEKLHQEIRTRCADSFKSRRKSRMLSNAEELNTYLQCAFDHFSQDLDTPFNFMDVAFRINAIPQDFGGNILKLAVAVKTSNRFSDPRGMFQELSFMVASCILLDCVRQNLKGPAEQILEKAYIDHCDTALEDFCAIFWPCSFSNKRGRCANVRDRHKKGHQNTRGQIIGTGPYESDFTWESFADDWLSLLQHCLAKFQDKVQAQLHHSNELNATTEVHFININTFYQRLGGADTFRSHSTCLCCLREMAEHPLPCGHVLCTPCIKGFGNLSPGIPGLCTIASCPLHVTDTMFPVPWEVYFKPPLAGVRILSLDGGGIRGIVILDILQRIEDELGGRIPVQEFFDLIVGTNTGGILALGIGIKNWSVHQATGLFSKLVDKAFTPRFAGMIIGQRKYRTRSLEETLQDQLEDELIFGGVHEDAASYARKVAVTASCETGEQAVIFTNYNRLSDDQISYRLDRPDNPDNELKLWEAARATSAAPTSFRPFVNSRTQEAYVDGAVFHNNPVRIANYESKLLWPDVEDHHPDILLSIGTGHNGAETEGFVDISRLHDKRVRTRNVLTKKPPEQLPRALPVRGPFEELNSWINILLNRVDNILDSESIWRNFRSDVIGNSSHIEGRRYTRLSPRIRFRTPRMDDKEQFQKLHDEVKSRLDTHGMRVQIAMVAQRLVASSFYFVKSGPLRESEDHFIVQGTIACRFTRGSENLRNIGAYLQKRQLQSFQPSFSLQDVKWREKPQRINISPKVIRDMTEFGFFDLGSIVIPLSSKTATLAIEMHLNEGTVKPYAYHSFPISGFPRILADAEPLDKTRASLSPPNELPKMTSKRYSVREKHKHLSTVTSVSAEAPSAGHKKSNSTSTTSTAPDTTKITEVSTDISEWIRRQRESKRRPPKPVQSFEFPPSGPIAVNMDSKIDEDSEDLGLAEALRRGEEDAIDRIMKRDSKGKGKLREKQEDDGRKASDEGLVTWSEMFVRRTQ